jgi:glycosyltransferase involved in cell wall biosynthesis
VILLHPQHPVRHPDGPAARSLIPDTPAGADPHPWYRTDTRVRSDVRPDLAEHWIDGGSDVVVATTWHVVPQVKAYSARLGRKVFFLQDYESYRRPDGKARRAMVESLRHGWPIIAGSAPVRRLVEEVTGQTCPVVACAVDGATFRIDVPIDADSRRWIGFPARGEWSKRTSDAVKALALLQSWRDQRLNVWCFGRFASDALPNWVEHHVFPEDIELRRLYNRSAVFLVPSAWEGFGLPGAEAMACGAALVSTRNDGVDAYATHGESALLCPVNDHVALAAAVGYLLDDRDLRRRLAVNGASAVARRSWSLATHEFEACLRHVISAR